MQHTFHWILIEGASRLPPQFIQTECVGISIVIQDYLVSLVGLFPLVLDISWGQKIGHRTYVPQKLQ